jgi:hypothetical protein
VKGILSTLLLISLLGCASEHQARESSQDVVVENQKSFATLEKAFSGFNDPIPLNSQRTFSLGAHSHMVNLSSEGAGKPFIIFKIEKLKGDETDLVIRTQGLSLGLQKIGVSFPKVFVLKGEKAIEVPVDETVHYSEIGACLKSAYSYPLKAYFTPGMKVIVVNSASGFANSLGKVDIQNPNFQLRKDVGMCGLVEAYPTIDARYEISLR